MVLASQKKQRPPRGTFAGSPAGPKTQALSPPGHVGTSRPLSWSVLLLTTGRLCLDAAHDEEDEEHEDDDDDEDDLFRFCFLALVFSCLSAVASICIFGGSSTLVTNCVCAHSSSAISLAGAGVGGVCWPAGMSSSDSGPMTLHACMTKKIVSTDRAVMML